MFMRLWKNSHFLCIKNTQISTKCGVFLRPAGRLIKMLPVRGMMDTKKTMTDCQFYPTLIIKMMTIRVGLCLCLFVNCFLACVWPSVCETSPRTSVSRRRSQLGEKSVALPADVIGGNISVSDWDKRYHKVTLSPCV